MECFAADPSEENEEYCNDPNDIRLSSVLVDHSIIILYKVVISD